MHDVQIQRHKAIFNNHACPQYYNNFIQRQFLIYRNGRHFHEIHCNVNKTFTFLTLEGRCAIIWDFFEFAI